MSFAENEEVMLVPDQAVGSEPRGDGAKGAVVRWTTSEAG